MNQLSPAPVFYLGSGFTIVVYLSGFMVPFLMVVANLMLMILILALVTDGLICYRRSTPVIGYRFVSERLSLGDQNEIKIVLEPTLQTTTSIILFDEIPVQLPYRDLKLKTRIHPGKPLSWSYTIYPTERGEYQFGNLILLVEGPFRMVRQRVVTGSPCTVAVYPSFLQMKKYELLAVSGFSRESGLRKFRRIGHSLEFEQIRAYVPGDDVRTLNWKSTARARQLMVNQFQDERSQSVYAMIDMGRTMQRAFNGLTYLDHSINATLALLNIVMKKDDRAGLITFSNSIHQLITAEKKPGHLHKIMQALYNQQTKFHEPDYEALIQELQRNIPNRSLLLLFSNPETLQSLNRHLHALQMMARRHVVVVIFFTNTELESVHENPTHTKTDAYRKALAEMLELEKHQIVSVLRQYGLYPLLTSPKSLTIDAINQYLELKSRGII